MMGVIAGGTNLIGGVANGLSGIANLQLSLSAEKPYFVKLPAPNRHKMQRSQNKFSPFEHELHVDNVSFHYGEKTVLNHASFRFEKGKKHALTGPSGCGKSTI